MVARRPDDAERIPYRNRIAVAPGDPPIAYRPDKVLVDEVTLAKIRQAGLVDETDPRVVVEEMFSPPTGDPDRPDCDGDGGVDPRPDLPPGGQRYRISGVPDPLAAVEWIEANDGVGQFDYVYFASGSSDCCGCPPHPALVGQYDADPWRANPWRANPWRANPWRANPWRANPWRATPWRANPWRANAEQLNLLATGKAPMSSVMPAPDRSLPVRPPLPGNDPVRIGVLDSGLAGGWTNSSQLRPALFGTSPADLARISGPADLPSRPMGGKPADNYLDPVAGHGTFIAGIIEQLTPGCEIRVESVFEPEGDVGTFEILGWLWWLMHSVDPQIVNLSFGGTAIDPWLEWLIGYYVETRSTVFVAAAGNEGTCVEQYPAALNSVISVAGLGPSGPAEWSNYGVWVDACAPGTDLVSAFFAEFNGDLPPINGVDTDDFTQWATWTGTSFAAPVVVAALARELASPNTTAGDAVDRVIGAPHLTRLADMGTIVNF